MKDSGVTVEDLVRGSIQSDAVGDRVVEMNGVLFEVHLILGR